VLSRCLRLSFAPLAIDDVAERLTAAKGLKADEAKAVAALTMGSLGRALDPEMDEWLRQRQLWVEAIISVADSDCRKWLALSESLSGAREEPLKFLDWLERWYRDVLVFLAAGNDGEMVNLDVKETIQREADRCGLEPTLFLLSQTRATAAKIRRNANRRIALDRLFAQMAKAAK
jgi:DNA polymerase-3 subunit delta'